MISDFSNIPTIASIWESGALGLMIKGGPFMWVILVVAIVAIAVVIERYRSMKMLDLESGDLRDQVMDLITNGKIDEARELCDKTGGPVAAILGDGIRKYDVLRQLGYNQIQIEKQVSRSMENYGTHVVAALERHLPVLATVASVAPMLGFLGTVGGMRTSFIDIVAQAGKSNIVELAASGIEIALLTTLFGLIVGIPAYMAYNYFSSIINNFVLDVESAASELNEVISMQMVLEQGADVDDDDEQYDDAPPPRQTIETVDDDDDDDVIDLVPSKA